MVDEGELIRLLAEIRARPALYLGKESISLLAAFLDGFVHGKGGQGQFDSELFVGFQSFVRSRFGMSSSHRWNDVILFFETDEARGFWRFFELFDEYRRTRDGTGWTEQTDTGPRILLRV